MPLDKRTPGVLRILVVVDGALSPRAARTHPMRFVSGRVVRKAVLVNQARAVDPVDALAKPSDLRLVLAGIRGVEKKKHQSAAYPRVRLRRVVIRSPIKTGRRVV